MFNVLFRIFLRFSFFQYLSSLHCNSSTGSQEISMMGCVVWNICKLIEPSIVYRCIYVYIVVQFIVSSPVELFPTLDSEAEATTRFGIIVIDHQPHWSLFIILAKWWFSNNLYSLYQVNESLKLVSDSEKWNQVGSDENVYDLLNSSYEYWTNLNPWRWLNIYYEKVSSEVIYEEGQHWLHSLYT